ncbi:MAG: aldolase/citrate lyase family protein [Lachnospiraceae bacterium]|nr:aldolase/citrate lyase family protein [Lachnospiraceae bacterium]
MSLQMMYITNNPQIAKIAEKYSVDRIWVDLEQIGKKERQGGMNTVQSTHTIQDVQVIRNSIEGRASLQVRVNPIYDGSKSEIDKVIEYGADIIMLPFFSTTKEVEKFIDMVDGRARTCLLLETVGAEKNLDEILEIPGIDEIHIGLNDLHLQYHMDFMFELLSNGKVEEICNKIKNKGIPYGFGGIAKLDEGMLPARHIIAEHYRLGSGMAILSRSFYDSWIADDMEEVERTFKYGLGEIREYEKRLEKESDAFFEHNRKVVQEEVESILKVIRDKRK